jgi:predicted transcriptional regulator of viral defense system
MNINMQKQVFHASELFKILGSQYALDAAVKKGTLQKLSAGFYSTPDIDPFVASIIAVSKHYKNVVISNLTALMIHELGDEYLTKVDVDIPRTRSIRNQLVQAHRVSTKKLVGITQIKINGYTVDVYDVERTLCDIYMDDPESHIFFKALKRYKENKEINSNKIKSYDEILKTDVLSKLKQELADG